MYVAGFSASSRIIFLPVRAALGHVARLSPSTVIELGDNILLNNIDITTNKYIYLLKSNSICYKLLYIIKTKFSEN